MKVRHSACFASSRSGPGARKFANKSQPFTMSAMALHLPSLSDRLRFSLGVAIGTVWVFHGLYSKILQGVPRHQLIVGRVLGEHLAGPATLAIGCSEILLGCWIFSGRARWLCALVQTLVLVAMNSLEVALARDLLLSAPGMLMLNTILLLLVWFWAVAPAKSQAP